VGERLCDMITVSTVDKHVRLYPVLAYRLLDVAGVGLTGRLVGIDGNTFVIDFFREDAHKRGLVGTSAA